MALGVWSRSVGESVKLILHSGRPYGTDTPRQRHDHARGPSWAPLKELAARQGLNQKTVAKWRKRVAVRDACIEGCSRPERKGPLDLTERNQDPCIKIGFPRIDAVTRKT